MGVMVSKRKVELQSQVKIKREQGEGAKEYKSWRYAAVVLQGRAGGQGEGVDAGGHGGEAAVNWELKPRLKQEQRRKFIDRITRKYEGDNMGKELEGEGDAGEGGSRIFRFLGDELDPNVGSPSKKPKLTGFKAVKAVKASTSSSAGNQPCPPCTPPAGRGVTPTYPPGHKSEVDGQKRGLQTSEAASTAWRSCWGREAGTIRSRRTGTMGTQWGWGADTSSLSSSSNKLLPNTHSNMNTQYLSENILSKRDMVHLPPASCPALQPFELEHVHHHQHQQGTLSSSSSENKSKDNITTISRSGKYSKFKFK